MKQTKWTLPLASLIVGISLVGAVCQANPSVQKAAHESDSADSYSAAALYNLGNAYARQGKPALAVLNYERARLLAPRDPDTLANLAHERESALLPAVPTRFEDHFRILNPNVSYWLGLTGLILAGVSGLLLTLKRFPSVVWRAAFGGGLFMTMFTLCDAAATARVMREAVVMQSAPASAAPISDAETLFTMPPGSLVQVEDQHGGFTLIRDSQGNAGWVPRAKITTIIQTEDLAM